MFAERYAEDYTGDRIAEDTRDEDLGTSYEEGTREVLHTVRINDTLSDEYDSSEDKEPGFRGHKTIRLLSDQRLK